MSHTIPPAAADAPRPTTPRGGRGRLRHRSLAAASTAAAMLLTSAIAWSPAPAQQQPGAPAPQGQEPEQQKPKKDKKKKGAASDTTADGAPVVPERKPGSALFLSEAPLRLTIRADFRTLFKNRDTLRVKTQPAMLIYETAGDANGGAARAESLEVSLAPRGHFRLKASTCGFPPVRVIFDRGKTKGTPFAGQRSLKLATHCRNGDRDHAQYVLREYLAYKVFNLFTERSFRARRTEMRYVEARDTTKVVTAPGFFIESERELAGRHAARILTVRGGTFADFDRAQTDLLSVFEYFIGNTDFSLWSLHNIRLLAEPDGTIYPVPYDFDWAGVVGTYYAVPDPRLPIQNVKQRIYRGPCRTAEELAPVFARFVALRDSITALYRSIPELDGRYVKDMERYYAEFYEKIGDRKRWKSESERACAIGA